MHPYLPAITKIIQSGLLTNFNRILRISSAVCICLLLSNCASSPPTPQPPIENREVATEESDLIDQDTSTPFADDYSINIERAEYYQDQAANLPSSGDRVDSTLSAAEYFVQANDYFQAQQTVDRLSVGELNNTQFNRYSIIKAYVDYASGQFESALQRLAGLLEPALPWIPSLEESSQATTEPDPAALENQTQRVDALLLSSFCYQRLNNFEAAIAALIQREALLVGNARAENARYTWQIINSLSTELRQSIIMQTSDVLVRNRLEQSLEGQYGTQTELPPQFDQWRRTTTSENKQVIASDWGPSSPKKIAVLLPLTSRFSKAAYAVMDGIEYKHNANLSSYKPTIDFYDVGSEPYQAGQYYSAISRMDYDLVIGPIGKDYANQLYTSVMSQPYGGVQTLLLGGDIDLRKQTTRVFSRLTMSPEADGVEVANYAQRQGHLTAALLVPDNEIGQRTSQAFMQRWLSQGGNISKTITYSPTQFDHSVELKQLFDINQSEYRHTRISNTLGFKPEFSAYRRSDVDFIFMVADNDSGRIVRPQINFFSGQTLPVYSSSAIFNGIQDEVNNLDLEQTEFPVMPWVLQSAEIAPYAGQLNMLFATGSDAYQVAANYQTLRNNPALAIAGNMGTLHFEESGEISYTPVWAKFNEGLAQASTELPALDNVGQFPGDGFPDNDNQSTETGLNSYDDSNWDSRRSSRKTGVSIP